MWFAPKLHFLVAPKLIESFLDKKSRSTNNQPLSSSWGDLTALEMYEKAICEYFWKDWTW